MQNMLTSHISLLNQYKLLLLIEETLSTVDMAATYWRPKGQSETK